MFDTFNLLSEIYKILTMSFSWSADLMGGLMNIVTLPGLLSAYVPPVITASLYVVVTVGVIKTVLAILPF